MAILLIIAPTSVAASQRGEALQICEHFGAKTVDLTDKSMIAMATGNSDKIDAMIAMISKFGIIELVRTGKVVMARGNSAT